MGLAEPYSHLIALSFFSAGLHFLEGIIDILCFYIVGEITLWRGPKYFLREHRHKQGKRKSSLTLCYLTMDLKNPLQN